MPYRAGPSRQPSGRGPAVRLNVAGVGEHLPKSARWPAVTRPVAEFRPTATVLVELAGGAVLVEKDVSGAINLGAQRARLAKDLATAQKELAGTEATLVNLKFTERAPSHVVADIRSRRVPAAQEIDRLSAQLTACRHDREVGTGPRGGGPGGPMLLVVVRIVSKRSESGGLRSTLCGIIPALR